MNKSQVKNMVKSILGNQNVNLKKRKDTTLALNTNANPSYIQTLAYPSSGNTSSTRVGDGINIDKFECRFTIQLLDAGAAETGSALVRIIVFQIVGESIPVASDVIDNTGSTIGTIVSPYGYDTNKKLVRVLYDVHSSVDTFNRQKYHNVDLKPSLRTVRYDNNNAVWTTGQAYVLYLTSINNFVNTTVNITTDIRTWFYDV